MVLYILPTVLQCQYAVPRPFRDILQLVPHTDNFAMLFP